MPGIAAILAAIGPWLFNLLRTQGPKLFTTFLGSLGLVIATNELVTEPIMDQVMSAWGGIPGDFGCWLGTFGVTKAASIMISSLTLIVGKKLFFARRSAA